MRFTIAWANIIGQNLTLKVVVGFLTLLCGVLGISLVKTTLRDPLIIERACYTRAAAPSSSTHTETEIANFLREALPERFDSNTVVTAGHLSPEEDGFRAQEQAALKSSNMTQRIIVNAIKVEKGRAFIDADRLVSVGQVRSAFRFPLNVTVASTLRIAGNPYGLILVEAKPTKGPEEQIR